MSPFLARKRKPTPPPQPLPVPPRHCRWVVLGTKCAPNEKMTDYTSTGPDGRQYVLCCAINQVAHARPGTPIMRQANPVAHSGPCIGPDYSRGCVTWGETGREVCLCSDPSGTVTSKSPCGQGSYACGTNPDGTIMCCNGRSGRQVMPMTPRMARRVRARVIWRNPTLARPF
jgi:hypothetical protein